MIIKYSTYILFSISVAILVLWQLLLPGYVITLDMAFGPFMQAPVYGGENTYPLQLLLYGLHMLLGGMLLQKLLLISVFFLLAYVPLHHYPFKDNYGVRYLVALLFTINPFVYERFLAGQWTVLVGYTLLFPVVATLLRFTEHHTRRNAFFIGVWIGMTGVFSQHFFMIDMVLLSFFVVLWGIRGVRMPHSQLLRDTLLQISVCIGTILLLTAYWIAPILIAGEHTVVESFGREHWEVFTTARDAQIGALGNVATLHGFWGEHEAWVTQFRLPKDVPLFWTVGMFGLALLVLYGALTAIRKKQIRVTAYMLLLIGGIAFVFSCGMSESVFRNFNLALFEHIPLWQGFRDSQKWSGVIVVVYALFYGLGAHRILELLPQRIMRSVLYGVFVMLPLFATSPMVFGFGGQLQPVAYPDSWAQVTDIMQRSKNCKAIFLPWHHYYRLGFADGTLAVNTATKYFPCEMITSQDAEIGDVRTTPWLSTEYHAIAYIVEGGDTFDVAAAAVLRGIGIQYVVATPITPDVDIYDYSFLQTEGFVRIVDTPDVVLYMVQ